MFASLVIGLPRFIYKVAKDPFISYLQQKEAVTSLALMLIFFKVPLAGSGSTREP